MVMHWVKQVFHWDNFYSFLAQEAKGFAYLIFLFLIFRVAFIISLYSYLGNETTAADIATALFYGGKISLKSAGLLTVASASIGLMVYIFCRQWSDRVRKIIGGTYIVILTLLFCGRIPYYQQFLSGYNQLIFNTVHDDMYALFISLIDQFNLPLRLLMVAVLSAVLYYIYQWWLRAPFPRLPELSSWWLRWLVRAAFLLLLYKVCIFVNFGGSMSYATDLGWENAGVTKDRLLNEAILDDVQALYRAYEMNGRMESSTGLAYSVADVKSYAKYLSGRDLGDARLDEYLRQTAQGAPTDRPPHVFLIIAESYANWPLLPKYENLHLADGMKSLSARPDSVYIDTFLPNGMSTISAVMGIVTGLADANLYLTTMPEAYTEPYKTALAPQVSQLGYRPRFWYAGPASWEKVQDFVLAQGFADFYGSGDYNGGGNVWGCDDKVLYQAVLAGIKDYKTSFNIVLSVSNHSPFTVDLAAAGFDKEALARALPEKLRDDEELIKQLGHYWYADKMMSDFIVAAEAKYPGSLFFVVGDHADRVNIDKTPSVYERYGVPLILIGAGVDKAKFAAGAVGSHIDVIPTVMELIAPKEFSYYSIGKSLTRGNSFGVNYGLWVTDGYIGAADGDLKPEAINAAKPLPDQQELRNYIDAVRSLSWWIGKYGNETE